MMSAETRKIKNYIDPIYPTETINANSLLDGDYDEKEAQEAFKKAVMEWRNSKPQTKTIPKKNSNNNNNNINKVNFNTSVANYSKNASIGTDSDSLNTNRSNKTIKELENQITKHSLTYAERCLLQKYRRNDIEFVDGVKSESDKSESTRLSTQKSLNLNDSSKF